MGLLDKLQAKIELNRIEDKYVKRVNRNAYSSDAQYVNGEYVYKCRQSIESPPSRFSKQPTTSKLSKPSSSNSNSNDSKSSTSRSSTSRDSDRSTSSRGSGKSGSTSKWSVFS